MQDSLAVANCGRCPGGEEEIPLAAERAENLVAQWAGTYREPFYWVEGADPRIWNVDPAAAFATEITITLEREQGKARGFDQCDGEQRVPMQFRVRTADGRLDEQQRVWLTVRTDASEAQFAGTRTADTAFQILDEQGLPLTLSTGQSLQLWGTHNGELRGFLSGGPTHGLQGILHTLCGGAFQLPLDERPDSPEFASVPTPSEAVAELDGRRFTLTWSDGAHIALTARVQAVSQTACWERSWDPMLRFDAMATWLDESGQPVALTGLSLATPRFAGDWPTPAPGCPGMWTGLAPGECTVLRGGGGGFLYPLSSATPAPPDHIPVASLEALLGPDTKFAQGGYLRFTVDLRYQQGSFDAVRAAFVISGPNAGDEQRTAVSDE